MDHSLNSGPVSLLFDSAPLEDPVEIGQVGDLHEGPVLGHALGRVAEIPLGVSKHGVFNARLPFRLRRFVVVILSLVLLRVVPGGFAGDGRIGPVIS